MFKLANRLQQLGEEFFSPSKATPVTDSRLVHVNRELQSKLGLGALTDSYLNGLLSGRETVPGYSALAMVYAGHQFGVAVPQLGDGRAMLIAEHLDGANRVWELQLKGAGKTPYSRMGDGRAVLRSTIREYLGSQAMDKLGLPTTLALALIDSNTPVYREKVETAAILLRVAPSFIRFGNFEFFAKRKKIAELAKLSEYVMVNYYPTIDPKDNLALPKLLEQVVKATAETIAGWQSIGFVHGVMNSDNMSILGLTLDYGPFAFIDSFDPEQIFNHSDSEGRYVYAKQAYTAWWNLYRLAEALLLIYPSAEQFEGLLAKFSEYYNAKYRQLMQAKLGLVAYQNGDELLLEELLALMQTYHLDWSFVWRKLSYASAGILELKAAYPTVPFDPWLAKLAVRYQLQQLDDSERSRQMQQVNPALVLRNHLLEYAITRAQQADYSEVERLFNALANPFYEDPAYSDYYRIAPEWSKHIVLSCSS